ncbi:transcriptional regulator with XRE-family HTH domain [Paenibacillus phyllosphaerae]|uniref:Transcriptional regulator with XRE-family HTH domain n=1 Tax=Paenibacillus phyllosphaerae TaxID=274593 RepID=A0A7W5AXM3_9BACL|nr:helix-turn-helix transcriptional regulator [Paenibacillus phyllosphaerae]MBB3110146.1 transcriptional regulator with XRE-family HTH domain [Paenibacillus phyllosphaerae]
MTQTRSLLGEFLKSRREKLQPADVGIGGGYGRRRTPGLRREEVAEIANVSTTWYTWLEQGRDVAASRDVMANIARALLLSPDETLHVMRLSGFGDVPDRSEVTPTSPVEPGLQKIIDHLPYPAIIVNRRTEIIAWNRLAPRLLYDFLEDPAMGRNLVWSLFMNPYLRERVLNWEAFAEYSAAILRSYYGQSKGDGWYASFANKLSAQSDAFAALWDRLDVQEKKAQPFTLNHPELGELCFEIHTFGQINGNEDVHCCVYTPMAGSGTEEKVLNGPSA